MLKPKQVRELERLEFLGIISPEDQAKLDVYRIFERHRTVIALAARRVGFASKGKDDG